MIDACLGDLSIDEFRRDHLARAPIAKASTLLGHHLLDWTIVEQVLQSPGHDTLVVTNGQLVPRPPPVDRGSLRALLDAGIGLCIRRAERCHPGLARIAEELTRAFGEAQVQLFVTPGGSHSFGWHYDDEHVFIAQTLGVKDYYFRANTVAADVRASPGAFAAYARETSVMCTARLVAGDFLYIPARWWHVAMCREESLSISVGVRC